MDFSKVQKQRYSDKTRKRLTRLATALFTIAMVLTFVPKYQERELKREVSSNSESILKMLQIGNLQGAYELGLTAGLKKQHSRTDFENTFRSLAVRKGGIEEWRITGFASRPQGKPYDLISYRVSFTQGVATLDFAMVKEANKWMVRAYRIRATGLF